MNDSQISSTTTPDTSSHDHHFGFYIEGLTLTTVSTLGIVGNVLSLVVLFRPAFRKSFPTLLRGLACLDALFLTTAIISFGLPQLFAWYKREVFIHVAPFVFGMLHIFRVGSVYVTMAVTLERFLAVSFPLRSFGCKKYLLPSCLLFSSLYNLPKFFEIKTVYDEGQGTHVIERTELRKNYHYATLYVIYSKLIFTELLPYFTIVVLNVFIVWKTLTASRFRKQFTQRKRKGRGKRDNKEEEMEMTVELDQEHENNPSNNKDGNSSHDVNKQHRPSQVHQVQQQQQQHRHHQQQQADSSRNLLHVLLGISALFIICQSLKIVPDLYELIFCGGQERCNAPYLVNLIVKLSHLLVCINSSLNFLFYFLQGAKFRSAFKDTFLECRCKVA